MKLVIPDPAGLKMVLHYTSDVCSYSLVILGFKKPVALKQLRTRLEIISKLLTESANRERNCW